MIITHITALELATCQPDNRVIAGHICATWIINANTAFEIRIYFVRVFTPRIVMFADYILSFWTFQGVDDGAAACTYNPDGAKAPLYTCTAKRSQRLKSKWKIVCLFASRFFKLKSKGFSKIFCWIYWRLSILTSGLLLNQT